MNFRYEKTKYGLLAQGPLPIPSCVFCPVPATHQLQSVKAMPDGMEPLAGKTVYSCDEHTELAWEYNRALENL